MTRILIIADDARVAECIRRALRNAVGCVVIGWTSAHARCSAPVRTARPDLVLIDDVDGGERCRTRITEAAGAAPDARIVLLTRAMDGASLETATRAGAHAALSRDLHPVRLGSIVREIAAGQVYHAFSRPPVVQSERDGLGLTSRELEVLQLVARGASNNQIAGSLWVTEQTVKFHLSNAYRKLGVSNRTEASCRAQRLGLVELGDEPLVPAA